jgi:hypothetical protein
MAKTEKDIQDNLRGIADAAKRLNREADEINNNIGDVNDILQDAGVGVEHWHERPLEFENDDRYANYLGFARCGTPPKWQLAIKTSDSVNAIAITPLLREPRHTRIQALKLIPVVLAEIRARLEAQVAELAGANAAAKAAVKGGDSAGPATK